MSHNNTQENIPIVTSSNDPIVNPKGLRKVCVFVHNLCEKPCANCYAYEAPCDNCKSDDDIIGYTNISYSEICLFALFDRILYNTYYDFYHGHHEDVQDYKWDEDFEKTLRFIPADNIIDATN